MPRKLWEDITKVLRVRAARFSIFIYVFTATAVQMTLACLTYWLIDTFHLSDTKEVIVVVVAQVSGLLAAVLLRVVAKNAEKKQTLKRGILVWLLFYAAVPFVSSQTLWVLSGQ